MQLETAALAAFPLATVVTGLLSTFLPGLLGGIKPECDTGECCSNPSTVLKIALGALLSFLQSNVCRSIS